MTEPRTDLRDARLHKALAHAPDADALPAPSTRYTIKNIAANVVPTGARAIFETKKPWWRAFWEKTGRAGLRGRASGPWNAAFATLLLGGIITLIWHGQPVPDAVLDERPAAPQVPDAAQPAPAVVPPVPVAVPAPSPAAPTAPTAPKDVPLASVPAPAPAPGPALGKNPKPVLSSQQRDQAEKAASNASVSPPTPAPTAPATTAAAKADLSASAQAALRREAPAFEKRELPAGGAVTADKSTSDAPAAPRAAPPAAAAPAPQTTGSAGSVAERIARNDSNHRSRAAAVGDAALQPGEWTAVDVLSLGRTARLARRDAQNLVNRAVALAETNAAPKADGQGGVPVLRLQLIDQNSRVAVAQFDLWGSNAFRWQRAGQADVAGSLMPEAAAGLLADAARALPP